jgi:hypothetical protein
MTQAAAVITAVLQADHQESMANENRTLGTLNSSNQSRE